MDILFTSAGDGRRRGINRHHLRKDCRLFKLGHFFLILFFSRELEPASIKRILVGTGVGLLFLNALTINHGIIKAEELGELATPLPVIIVWALITIWMLSAGLRKEQ